MVRLGHATCTCACLHTIVDVACAPSGLGQAPSSFRGPQSNKSQLPPPRLFPVSGYIIFHFTQAPAVVGGHLDPSRTTALRFDQLRPCARTGYMQNAIPTSAPGNRAPTSEEPAPIKMINQLDQASKPVPWPVRAANEPTRALCVSTRRSCSARPAHDAGPPRRRLALSGHASTPCTSPSPPP
jgi:hypothetical protein